MPFQAEGIALKWEHPDVFKDKQGGWCGWKGVTERESRKQGQRINRK